MFFAFESSVIVDGVALLTVLVLDVEVDVDVTELSAELDVVVSWDCLSIGLFTGSDFLPCRRIDIIRMLFIYIALGGILDFS